jgi:hypothetical protein
MNEESGGARGKVPILTSANPRVLAATPNTLIFASTLLMLDPIGLNPA